MPLLHVLIDHLVQTNQDSLPFPVMELVRCGCLPYLFWAIRPMWSMCGAIHNADPSGIFAEVDADTCLWGIPPAGKDRRKRFYYNRIVR